MKKFKKYFLLLIILLCFISFSGCRNSQDNSKITISRSCHTLQELKNISHFDYVFLSPIFDSISKQGYRAAFSMETLEQARGIIDEKVFALGGVTLDKITILEQLHFGGIAVYGKRSLQMLKEV